jgi:GT2 family glycosyltransferase
MSIIIVDNNSENESLIMLRKAYCMINTVAIVSNDKNLGFARGNNVGIQYARNIKKCEYVFILNSDTILQGSDTIFNILAADSTNVGVISPIVIGTDGRWQAPAIFSSSKLKRQIAFAYISVITNRFFPNLLNWMILLKRKFLSEKKVTKKEDVFKAFAVKNNSVYVIQGSAYVLTPQFFHYYTQLYPKTFLYWEEMCLAWYLHQTGLGAVLAENSPIVHKGGCSTSLGLPEMQAAIVRQRHVINGCYRILPLFFMRYKRISKLYSFQEKQLVD